MAIQWDQINPNKGATLTRPRELYAAIQGRKWSRLRPEQSEVLESWYERRTERDLVIKQNTGGGKTLTGLLIAQSGLHEGVGPAVYLVPDTFLIEQVVKEAEAARIPVTLDHLSEDFRASRATLVTTFHKLVNGRSSFGVRGVKAVTPLGVIIVDDAHSALSATLSLFGSTIPASCPAYKGLVKLFANELRDQSPKAYADLMAQDAGAPIRVPPKAVADRASEIMATIRPHANDPDIPSLFYSWPFVADHLKLATLTFTKDSVEIKTPCPLVSLIPAFADAPRRVYLTATLEDEGVLVTELAARPEGVGKPITPKQASDLGDRIILAPLSINPRLTDVGVHQLARSFADGDRNGDGVLDAPPVNVVVLVPSKGAAARWATVADATHHVKDMAPTIERLKQGEHVGVVVLINKYDGVDLPGDACRLLIIDGVPSPLNAHEQRESAALTGSMTFKARQVQRLEQGMGRGIRDVSDYCAVLVLTSEAALTLRNPSLRKFYSPATRAQVELSQQLAMQIDGEDIGAIRDLLNLFLERREPWVSKSIEATADVKYDTADGVSALAVARREAFDRASAGDLVGAVNALREGIDSLDDDQARGWYLEELATYQSLIDPVGSQQTLGSARKLNPSVLKPAVSPPIKKMKGPTAQSVDAAAFLGRNYPDARVLQLEVASLFENVAWGVDKTAELAEEQFRRLGLHLGFGSNRPEKEGGDGGPDNLWGLSRELHVVIELKTEVYRPNPVITKAEAEQLVHSLTWYGNSYSEYQKPGAVMVHPSNALATDAHLPPEARIVTKEDFDHLQAAVKSFVDELVADESWADPKSVLSALTRNRLVASQIVHSFSRKPVKTTR